MLKNTKGMTLVEMIVTIAVFSIAALLLATGFSTVIRYMGEASAIKNTSNEVFAQIESEDNGNLAYEEIYFKIQLDDGNVDNKINRIIAEKGITNDQNAYKVKYTKFSKNTGYVDTTLTFYEQVKESMEYCLANKNWNLEYKEAADELKKQGIIPNDQYIAPTYSSLSNDHFRRYFFVSELKGLGYPEVDQEILDKCDEIFDNMHQYDPSSANCTKYKLSKMSDTFYMKPIYMPDYKYVILIAETQSTPLTWDGWRTRLIYNPEDNHWYYKVFQCANVGSDNYFPINGFKTSDQWEKLQKDFKDASKWRRIEIN